MTNKPWLKKTDEEVIDVMGVKITLKKMSFGEARKATAQGMTFDMETGKSSIDPSLVGVTRTIAQIKDWELTDEKDKKLPITLNTFDNLLDEEFASLIIEAVTKRDQNNVTDKEKK
jgi:hypothetical protein